MKRNTSKGKGYLKKEPHGSDAYINKLPSDLQKAYIIIELQGKTPAEAAKIAGCSEEKIKEHLSWAKRGVVAMKAFTKPGEDWTEKEISNAFSYFNRYYLDQFIRFAFSLMKKNGYVTNEDLTNKSSVKLSVDHAYELSKDIVKNKFQDAFRRYLHTYNPKKYRKYAEKCPFCNWVYNMVAREILSEANREIKAKKKLLEEHKRQKEEVKRNISNHVSEMKWEEEIEPYLDKLTPKYREAIELKKQGLSHKEAGKKSRKPCKEGAMKVRLFRAKQELRILTAPDKENDINLLPRNQRQAYILVKERGNTHSQAALIMRCTEEEVRQYVLQAESMLKKPMKGGESWVAI